MPPHTPNTNIDILWTLNLPCISCKDYNSPFRSSAKRGVFLLPTRADLNLQATHLVPHLLPWGLDSMVDVIEANMQRQCLKSRYPEQKPRKSSYLDSQAQTSHCFFFLEILSEILCSQKKTNQYHYLRHFMDLNHDIASLISKMLTQLLPVLVGYQLMSFIDW